MEKFVTSQVVLESKLANSKNLISIIGKVAIQILAKNGVVVWNPEKRLAEGERVMMIGILAESSKGKNLVAVVSSVDRQLSEFRS